MLRFHGTLKKLQGIISDEEIKGIDKRTFKVTEEKIDQIIELVRQLRKAEEKARLADAVEALRKQPIAPILRKYASDAEYLAERLGKQVQVEVSGLNVEIFHENYQHVFAALTHLIRNSVDHGIESSDLRSMLGKPEVGTLKIRAEQKNGSFKIVISDDGGGIDAEKIKQIALSKGIITEQEASSYDQQEVIKLIFAPGFSTKESVSDVSGRGVGMDAVNAAVAEINGDIRINTILDRGTTFELAFPLN